MTTAADPAIRELSDRAAIGELMMLYASGLDRRDFGMVRQVFTADAAASYDGKPVPPGVDNIIAHVQGLKNSRKSTHFMMNQSIDLSGDAAQMETYAQSILTFKRPSGEEYLRTRGLRYICDVVRRQGRWWIAKNTHVADWEREEAPVAITNPPAKPGLAKAFAPLTSLTLEQLSDRAEIYDNVMRYAKGLDTRNWEMVRSCFTPNVYASYNARELGRGVEKIMQMVKPLEKMKVTTHFMGNQLIALHGASADVETYCIAYLVSSQDGKDTVMIRGLRYIDEFVKQGGQWLTSSRIHDADWARTAEVIVS